MHLLPLLSTLAVFSLPSLAIPIAGYIQPNAHLAHINELRSSTRVTLDYGAQYAYVLKEGNFSFPEVSPGVHTLQVLCSSHRFPELAIVVPPISVPVSPPTPSYTSSSGDLDPDASAALSPSSPSSQAPFILVQSPSHALPFDPSSPPSIGSLPHPIELSPLTRNDFYTSPGSFQAFEMFKNPMILLMVASAGMMFFLPKLLASMDPEAIDAASDLLAGVKSQPRRVASSPAAQDVVEVAEERVEAISSGPVVGGAGGKKKAGNRKKR